MDPVEKIELDDMKIWEIIFWVSAILDSQLKVLKQATSEEFIQRGLSFCLVFMSQFSDRSSELIYRIREQYAEQ